MDVQTGRGCLIQPYALLEHDIIFGDYSVFGPFASPSGSITYANRVYIDMDATIKERIANCDDAIASMGAVVYMDIEAKSTVIGNPARVTRK